MRKDWDALADWYSGWAGERGSNFHRDYAAPAVLDLLELKKGEKVLDIGCGAGAMLPYLKEAGADYTGVDTSGRMIDIAKGRYGKKGNFFVGNAMDLKSVSGISEGSFDAALFVFSIQDIEGLGAALKSARWTLKDDGRIVLFMLHPAFRIPRQSGWISDRKRKITSRRVDRYASETVVPLKQTIDGKQITNRFFHRSLGKYFEKIGKSGMYVDRFEEVLSEDSSEFPHFLALRLKEKGQNT